MHEQAVLRASRNGVAIEGVCIKYKWSWLMDGRPVTRAVNSLLRKHLMDAMYFRGQRATAEITDAGRAHLATIESRYPARKAEIKTGGEKPIAEEK